ncbi:uncharacterized protein LOC123265712 [Cotesia glomerata]|uniref:Uncharacterized protein n=1 Tax=Cotesia glomerata TaxID=32391 RepID=A0AAV7IZU0_COTGL|nr:uncharacterized protein LOC123265712 [Cotesia glomerata]KAH0561484.1 hypothetical protein KQX54_017055 [Cotesia glomerata]
MASKLFIILSIFLSQSRGNLITVDKLGSKSLLEKKPVITDINDKWLVNFVRTIDNKYESCQVMPIDRQVFIGDGECIYHAAKEDHWTITIDFYHRSLRFADMASVQDKNIFYNANFTSEYHPKKRKIAIMFADQPVLADNRKNLIRGIAQMAYEEVLGYNEANQMKKLAYNVSDTNFSKCFMPLFNGKQVVVRCFNLLKTRLESVYSLTEETFHQYHNILNFMFCHVNSSKEKVVLVGILSKPNKPSISPSNRPVLAEYENLDDLGEIYRKKKRDWYNANPDHVIYPLF